MRRALVGPALVAALTACGAPPAPPPRPPASEPAAPAVTAAPAAPRVRGSHEGPLGELVSLDPGGGVNITPSGGADVRVLPPAELHAPPGDRALGGISATEAAFLDDGTLLTGAGDGILTAFDGGGARRWSLGFRGAIRGITGAGEGLAAITTEAGVMALVGGDGRLRWERHVTAERLGPALLARDGTLLAASQRGVFAISPAGETVFTHAVSLAPECAPYSCTAEAEPVPALSLDGDTVVVGRLRFPLAGPHPPVASLVPTFPLTFRRVIEGRISSVVATGPVEVTALVSLSLEEEFTPSLNDRSQVVRVEGERITRLAVPDRLKKQEVFLANKPPYAGHVMADALVRSAPAGAPWVLARRLHFGIISCESGQCGAPHAAGQILDVKGKVEERREFFAGFSGHLTDTPILGAPHGIASLFCFAKSCFTLAPGVFREIQPPVPVTAVARIGDRDWILGKEGDAHRREGDGFRPVSLPAGAKLRAVAGTGERDVWADARERYAYLHYDGTTWTEVPVPLADGAIFPRAPDDTWAGRLHWDGKGWTMAHGAPAATTGVARGAADVWLGDDHALWHGTAPGPDPVRLPAPATADDAAIPAPSPIAVAGPETGFSAERATFAVPGGEPLGAGLHVSVSASGVLWITAWDRLVEVDRGKARVLRGGAFRWAHPDGAGRGVLLQRDDARGLDRRDEVIALEGAGKAARVRSADVQLDRHDLVAVDGHAQGATWVVGAPPRFLPGDAFHDWATNRRYAGETAWEEHAPHALVRAGDVFRPVLGLPSATWCDVSATADGGAWIAGGLSTGPAGEGILFHAGGRLGSEKTARFRAAAALLAVSAASPGDAWAVGAAGTVIHVRGTEVTRLALPSGEWLRAVLALGPDDVWIGGDGGTLLHFDGRAFHPVAHSLGRNSAITGLAASGGAVWAVSPSGILRIEGKGRASRLARIEPKP